MNPVLDYIFHGGTLGIFLVVAWKVISKLNRDDSLKRDYPPHRHINGFITYPQEYPAPDIGKLGHD